MSTDGKDKEMTSRIVPVSRRTGKIVFLSATLIAFFFLDIRFGSVRIPLMEIIKIITGQVPENQSFAKILLSFRMPKAIVALFSGAALAASGLLLQTVFHNPLAGPDVLGINSGASIGVALLVLFIGNTSGGNLLGSLGLAGYTILALSASLGSFVILLLILYLSRKFEDAVTLLILGMLVGYVTGAIVSLLVYFGAPSKVQVYLSWTYGSFGGVTSRQLPIFLSVIAVGFLILLRSRKPLDALLLGERYATSIGVNVRGERGRAIAAAAILTGTTTAFCGPIAFVGIAAPQAARRYLRASNHGMLIPASALIGALFCLGADIVSQLPGNGAVLPVNPLLAVVGAPVIISVFMKRNPEERA